MHLNKPIFVEQYFSHDFNKAAMTNIIERIEKNAFDNIMVINAGILHKTPF